MKKRSPTKIPFICAICLIAVICVLAVALFYVRERKWDKRKNDAGNLKVISASILFYAADNGGELPSGLDVLAKQNYIAAGGVFISPLSPYSLVGNAKPSSVDELKKSWGYVYRGAGKSARHPYPQQVVLMHTRLFRRNQWVNFLFLDGSVVGEKCHDINSVVNKNGWILIDKSTSPSTAIQE